MLFPSLLLSLVWAVIQDNVSVRCLTCHYASHGIEESQSFHMTGFKAGISLDVVPIAGSGVSSVSAWRQPLFFWNTFLRSFQGGHTADDSSSLYLSFVLS